MISTDFTHLSLRNKQYQKQSVIVANGVAFTVLSIADIEKVKASNVLYMHVHKLNRKCYIGITVQTAGARWYSGIAYKMNKRFGPALKKYGWKSFDTYILAFIDDRDSLNIAEISAIAAAGGHKSKFTYNLSPGGDIVAENDKPVVGVYLPTGEEREFKSGSEASRILDLGNTDYPMAIARGERQSVKDWWFRFKDDDVSQPPKMWGERLRLQKINEIGAKPLTATNYKSGETLHFNTQSEAAEALGIQQSSISMVLIGQGYSADGWWFRFDGDDRAMPKSFGFQAIREKRDIKVYATHLLTGEKRLFRNRTVADTELGIYKGAAASVVSGKRTSAAGWWFSFDENAQPPSEFKGALVAKARSKPVVAINLTTGIEQKYSSAKTAGVELGISRAAISKVIKGELKAVKGFYFRFA